MFCKSCGKELPDNTTFCSYCGTQLKTFSSSTKFEGGVSLENGGVPVAPPAAPVFNPPPAVNVPEPPKENKSKKGIIIAIIAVALAVAIGVGAFFFIKNKNEKDSGDDATDKADNTNQYAEVSTKPIVLNPDELVNPDDFTTSVEVTTEKVTGEQQNIVTPDVFEETTTERQTKPVFEVTTKPPTTKPSTTKPPSNSVDNWTKAEILAAYNNAVKKTAPKAPKGNSKLALSGQLTNEDTSATAANFLKLISPLVSKTLARNSVQTNFVPGSGNLRLEDLKSLKVIDNGSTYTIEMTVKSQTDGPSADKKSGPVGRAIGTLGDVDVALKELEAEMPSGRDTVTLTYDDVTIKATISKSTGLITSGNWHYLVKVKIGNARMNMAGISGSLKNLKANINYTVVI